MSVVFGNIFQLRKHLHQINIINFKKSSLTIIIYIETTFLINIYGLYNLNMLSYIYLHSFKKI